MEFALQQFLTGLSIASILLLVALGLSIIYGSMGVINLAHGEFVMLGAYSAWLLQTYVGISLLPSLVLIFLISNWDKSTNWSMMNVLTQIGLGYTFLFLPPWSSWPERGPPMNGAPARAFPAAPKKSALRVNGPRNTWPSSHSPGTRTPTSATASTWYCWINSLAASPFASTPAATRRSTSLPRWLPCFSG